jgi:hypothetical protein
MENNLYDFETEPEKRPSFLTWLCILTFIGSGWAIINCIWSYTTAHEAATMFSKNFQTKTDSTFLADSTAKTDTAKVRSKEKGSFFEGRIKSSFSKMLKEENIKGAAIGGFIAALLTLSGALLMWWQKRKGFYLYIAGVVFGIMVPFYLFGNDFLAVGATAFANFFGLVFIALYALNFRALK